MYRLKATFIKEYKLLSVDKTGITILFIMPVFLVFVMTLIQQQAYKSMSQSGVPVLLVNRDRDSLGTAVERGFSNFPVAQLTVDHGERFPNEDAIKKEIIKGKYTVALYIPANATKILEQNVEGIMSKMFNKDLAVAATSSKVEIGIIIDPTANKSMVIAVSGRLKQYLADVKTNVLFNIMGNKIAGMMHAEIKGGMPQEDIFSYKENYAFRDNRTSYEPDAVQHNIPAWAIFSIFFIVLPLGGGIINERSEGLFIRMRTLPGSYLSLQSGKLLAYFFIALIQFMLVILLGVYLLPLVGLPVLNIGPHLIPLVLLTMVLALAAVGYGLFIGTLFDTPQQSAVFGGISVLIMSALGGIWVPMNIMPEVMQKISSCSPLNWALRGYYELFIKGGDWHAIQGEVIKLLVFFFVCLAVSYRLFKHKTSSN